MSLLEKAQKCITLSQALLLEGDNAGSLECALEAAKYLQLIRLLRQGFMSEPTEEQLETLAKAMTREEIAAILKGIDPKILAECGIV
jgi:hypothetical protein